MNELTQHIDIIIVVIGSLLGSMKASVELDKGKPFPHRLLDILIGVFAGISAAFHFGSEFSVWLEGLLAAVAGASGAMALEVILQMLPGIVKTFVKNFISKFN